ncbi:hypothetical protein QO034_11250 [Sedimentitalea sp. JM2-8]|uniref:Uncharacterized protein n=1 Tax=Sedimentitalea xiamensis TaxID=3050037 RepID=A0ABT7FEZ3_9RHOB|nr:hypothetical protein [Sedimentitalea xiamensis]MDK3073689.1 hypothetical protein [Sedimentitalea xiamensis]
MTVPGGEVHLIQLQNPGQNDDRKARQAGGEGGAGKERARGRVQERQGEQKDDLHIGADEPAGGQPFRADILDEISEKQEPVPVDGRPKRRRHRDERQIVQNDRNEHDAPCPKDRSGEQRLALKPRDRKS